MANENKCEQMIETEAKGILQKIDVMSESELAVIAEEMDLGKDTDEHLLKMSTE